VNVATRRRIHDRCDTVHATATNVDSEFKARPMTFEEKQALTKAGARVLRLVAE